MGLYLPPSPGTVTASCPYHAALGHLEFIDHLFPDWDPADLPLFPQTDGSEVTPEAQAKLVEELAMLTGDEVLAKDGSRRYGKHAWRATGAV